MEWMNEFDLWQWYAKEVYELHNTSIIKGYPEKSRNLFPSGSRGVYGGEGKWEEKKVKAKTNEKERRKMHFVLKRLVCHKTRPDTRLP